MSDNDNVPGVIAILESQVADLQARLQASLDEAERKIKHLENELIEDAGRSMNPWLEDFRELEQQLAVERLRRREAEEHLAGTEKLLQRERLDHITTLGQCIEEHCLKRDLRAEILAINRARMALKQISAFDTERERWSWMVMEAQRIASVALAVITDPVDLYARAEALETSLERAVMFIEPHHCPADSRCQVCAFLAEIRYHLDSWRNAKGGTS